MRATLDAQSAQTSLSDPFEISLTDPCEGTTINEQLIQDLVTQVNAVSAATTTFSKFTDTISQQYSAKFGDGSGSDLCGP